ncbi:ATP-binding protein [uncultured Desulfuromusa sp.]|uniref:hybrid sensor histidine kinase/response regulator n=1 Tax=uncultured Desulfuromusa sp. TaxID=219183 RepID=UPI002AA92DCE|nr:ATP-binding protein [uncultured Desulfuromusa sp.]
MSFLNLGSIRKNLALLVIITALPAIAILFYSGMEERKRSISQTKKEVALIAHAMAQTQKNATLSAHEILATIALTTDFQFLDTKAVSAIFKKFLQNNPVYKNIVLIDLDGNVVAAGFPFEEVSLADRKHFQEALKTKDFSAGEFITTRIGNSSSAFPFAYPVLDSAGNVVAVLSVAVNLAGFVELYQQARLPKDSYVAVTDHKGIRLLYYPEKSATNPIGEAIKPNVWKIARDAQEPGIIVSSGSDGTDRINAYEQVRLNDNDNPYMYVWAGVPEEFILTPANTILKRNLFLLLLATLGSLLVAWRIGKGTFINPINRLMNMNSEFAKGNLEKRIEQDDKIYEFRQLAESFYAMTEALSLSREGLQESEATFRRLFEESSDPILLLDNSVVCVECNQAALDLLKMTKEQLIHLPISKFSPELQPDGRSSALISTEMGALAYKKGLHRFDWTCVNADGSEFIVDVSLMPIMFRGERMLHMTWRDITDRKRIEKERLELESQLRQKHKMEAVGYMAGGMAHNFNNNLSIILGNVELSQLKVQDPTVQNLLKNAKIGIMRSRDLISKIITYSRKGIHNKSSIQLLSIVDETIALLRSTLPATINLQKVTSPACASYCIVADASQIQEVLINLSNNAVQAMNEKGNLIISLELVAFGEKDIPAQYEAVPGTYAKLSVQDSGCGIPAEIVDKVFDPFFTTKEDYEGAGMGLATVQGIVAQHGGIIKVNSIPNQGTVFDLYFPIVKNVATELKSVNAKMPKGTEKILFVDDNEILATLGENILSEAGYQITVMTDSKDALNLLSANPDLFDLVITDQTMPDLTGIELIREIKKIKPGLRSIIITGYSTAINADAAKQQGIDAFCMKPLNMPEFLQTVRQVLDIKEKRFL